MNKDLIQAYKFLLDNTLSRSQEILGKKFITKLIKKAENITTKGGKSLLKGLEYSKKELQLDLLYKTTMKMKLTIQRKLLLTLLIYS